MKKFWILLAVIIVSFHLNSFSQCTGTQLNWQNPSFEGTPGTPHVTPPLWDICQPGVTPDTQPGCWGITLPASNGNSYVGFVDQASAGWHEGASQTLSSPMVAGTTYTFTLDLATTASTGGGIIPGCVGLAIYGNMGGNSGCDETELCWSSGNIFDAAHMDQWVNTTVTMTPTQNWTHLLFMVQNFGCTDLPYVMVDNLSPVSPIADIPQFTWTDVCLGNTMSFTDQSTSTQGTFTSWSWDFGDGSAAGSGQFPTHLYSTAGTYNVTLTAISTVPCTTTVTHPVIVNPLPTVIVTPGSTALCSGNSVALAASGATTYVWDPAAGLSATTGTTVTANPNVTTPYTVTGTDANGCANTTAFTITVNPNPTPTIAVVDATCGLSNGTATASPPGLTTYAWSNNLNGQTISSLPPGNYDVTVTDANGCTGSATSTIIDNPAGNVTITSTDEHCGHADGTATATIVGGIAPYTYNWSNAQNTSIITGLPAGNYTVTTQDGNGCTASGTATIINVAGPSLQILSTTNETCSYGNGAATADGINGTPPYTYLWSNSAITATISNLSAGTFGVTVYDANLCTAFNTVTLTDTPPPTLTTSSTLAGCTVANGTATANANGGLQPYTYSWSGSVPQATQIAVNLSTGTYTVTVTDANNCSAATSVTVTTTSPPSLQTNTTPADCGQADGAASVNANGGIQPYSYSWSSTVPQVTQTAVNLLAGTYTVTVTDANGCSAAASATINITNVITTTVSATPEYCDRADGTATASPIGGSGVYTYAWSDGQTTQTAIGLAQGTITVTVSDGFCSANASVNIAEIPGPTASFSLNPRVLTLLDGPVSFLDNSVGTNINWDWNYGDGTASGSGTNPTHQYMNLGVFTVTEIVTDNNGCKDTVQDSVKIKEIYTIYIPNAFTPNADLVNDIFLPRGVNIDPNNYELAIFDRWGKLVFKTNDLSQGWNGTIQNKKDYTKAVMDVYVYRIKLKEIDGPKHEYIGRVSLIP